MVHSGRGWEADSPLRDAASGIEDALHDDEVFLGTGVRSERRQGLTQGHASKLGEVEKWLLFHF